MTHGMLLVGRNFHLALEALAYEYPEVDSGTDADWVTGRVDLQLDTNPRVSVALDVSWRAEELDAFNSALHRLVEGHATAAELTHLERQIGVTISAGKDADEVSGWVTDDIRTRLEFRHFVVPRNATKRALIESDALARAFPVRGSLSA